MSGQVLLNLLNKLGEKIKCEALLSILLVFPNKFITIIQEHECKILFIIWHILFASFVPKHQDFAINFMDANA